MELAEGCVCILAAGIKPAVGSLVKLKERLGWGFFLPSLQNRTHSARQGNSPRQSGLSDVCPRQEGRRADLMEVCRGDTEEEASSESSRTAETQTLRSKGA